MAKATGKWKGKVHPCIECGRSLGPQCLSEYCSDHELKVPPMKADIIPWTAPKGTIEERVAELRNKHPKLTYDEAESYLVMQHCGEVSAVYLTSDGGGRFGNFARKLRKQGKL